MLPADVDAFSDTLTPLIDGIAHWQTQDGWTNPNVTLHRSLTDAVAHDPRQAFLRLNGEDGTTTGPTIQYLHTAFGVHPFGPSMPPPTPPTRP